MKKIIIILKFLFILTSLSLISCVKKQDQISNKSLGRFGADSISISYPSINHILNIGNPISIAPNSKVGKITACGIKYGTGSLPPGLFLDAQCNISGTPLVLAFTFNYKITAISEFNTTAEANITITVGRYYNLGDAVTGLGIGEIITISNGIDSKIVTADGDFNLSPTSNGDSYTITVVESNRSRFRCTVLKGSGVISQNINNIQINCLPYGTRKLSGALSGLIPADGSVQVSNAGVNVKLTADGTFKFGPLNHGTTTRV